MNNSTHNTTDNLTKEMRSAISFASVMMAKGTNPPLAIYKAAKYYGVDKTELAHYCGSHGGTKRAYQRKNNY